jgi:hypothetical protein
MVHLQGIDFHRDNVPLETRGHTLRHRGLTAAGRSGQSNDEDILLSIGVEFANNLHTLIVSRILGGSSNRRSVGASRLFLLNTHLRLRMVNAKLIAIADVED